MRTPEATGHIAVGADPPARQFGFHRRQYR
jgi:hypothetical protein